MAADRAGSIVTAGALQRDARSRALLAACLGVPVAVLAASYLWLALEHGTLALWNVVVHESARYTLRRTIFYHSHFLREVPVDIAYALFLLCAAGGAGLAREGAATRPRHEAQIAAAVAVLLVLSALLSASRLDGAESALRDLLQYRTRDDVAAYGSHWRYHWLSTLWFGTAVGLAPALIRRVAGRALLRADRRFERLAWGWFLLLTLVFGLSADVFLDIRYAGHQAREILTHGPVTAMLGIGLLLAVGARLGDASNTPAGPPARSTTAFRFAATLAIPGWLAAVSLSGDVMATAQSELGLSAMVAAHFFEHTLDYVLVALLVLAGLGFRSRNLHAAEDAGSPRTDERAAGPPHARAQT